MVARATRNGTAAPRDGVMREYVANMQELATNLAISRWTLAGYLDSSNSSKKVWTACKYPDQITTEEYRTRYERNGLANRVTNIYADESWALDPEVYETEDTNEVTEFERAWAELTSDTEETEGNADNNLNVMHYLHRVDCISGIGNYGILFLGLDDRRPMNRIVPGIDERGGPTGQEFNHKLLFLRAFDQTQVEIKIWETDPSNPRFGLPKIYDIQFSDPRNEVVGGQGQDITRKEVHWSRVIHVADNRMGSEVFGAPRQRPVYNWLLDYEKVLGGSAEMFYQGGFPGLSIESDPSLGNVTYDATKLKDEVKKYQEGFQRFIALTGMTAKSLSPQIAEPTAHLRGILQAVALTIGTPLRILTGSEEAKLSSTQDGLTWNKRLGRRQSKYLSPMLLRPFINRLIIYGVLPRPKKFHIVWPDLNTLTDEERATIAQKRTVALSTYVGGNVEAIFPLEEYLATVVGLAPELAKLIAKKAKDQVRFTEDPADVAMRQAMLKVTAAATNKTPTPGRGGLTGGQTKKPPAGKAKTRPSRAKV